jgi:hypothetical protein
MLGVTAVGRARWGWLASVGSCHGRCEREVAGCVFPDRVADGGVVHSRADGGARALDARGQARGADIPVLTI